MSPLHWPIGQIGMAWNGITSILKTSHFQSTFFLSDSHLPRPQSFSNLSLSGIFGPSPTHFSLYSFNLSVGPRSCWTPGIEHADSLVKIGATLSFADVSSPLSPVVIAKIRYILSLVRYLETKFFSPLSLLPDSFGFLRETGPFPPSPL